MNTMKPKKKIQRVKALHKEGEFLYGITFHGKPYVAVSVEVTDIVIIRGEDIYKLSLPKKKPISKKK